MTKNHEAVMKKYGIQVEESHTYLYKGFRYRNLDDAVNYAILQEKNLKVTSVRNSKEPKRGDPNAITE